MKYNSLKDKIEALIEQNEENKNLIKKKTETISNLKKIAEQNNELINDLKNRHDREIYFNKEKMIRVRKEMSAIKEEREKNNILIEKLTCNFEHAYEEHKQKLNSHYYVLQRAFNDYIKTKINNNDIMDALNKLESRLNDLEKQTLGLFFESNSSEIDK